MNRYGYPSDLSDAQGAVLTPLIPPAKSGGRRRTVDIREIVNAIFYLTKTGCDVAHLAPLEHGAYVLSLVATHGGMGAHP